MLGKMLQNLIDEKRTTVREIGELTGAAPSTVYRWLRSESEPSFDAIRLLVRHLPDRQAQGMLLAALTAATSWRFYNLDVDLDVNRDGRITTADALDSSIEAVHAAGKSLAAVRDACRKGQIPSAVALDLIQTLQQVIRQCSITQQVLARLGESTEKRKIKR